MSSFSVVKFVDEVDSDGCKKVDIVPSEWFHDAERKLCWWPPASLVNVTKAVKEGTPPTSNWILCNVRVMGNAGKFDFICTLHLYFLFFKSLYMHFFFYLEAFVCMALYYWKPFFPLLLFLQIYFFFTLYLTCGILYNLCYSNLCKCQGKVASSRVFIRLDGQWEWHKKKKVSGTSIQTRWSLFPSETVS